MFNHGEAMRAMAAKYSRLALEAKDPGERVKFFDYAKLYAGLSEREEWRETLRPMAGETWSAEMFPNEMFPNEEPSKSHDLTVDEASSTLRVTAELFQRSAAATSDKEKREALLE